MTVRSADFESAASACSATRARRIGEDPDDYTGMERSTQGKWGVHVSSPPKDSSASSDPMYTFYLITSG